MKKLVVLGIVMSLSFAVIGCGNVEIKNEEKVKEEIVVDGSSSKEEKEGDFIYGKVKSIVGNEIEIELAKEPNVEIEATKDKDETVKKEEGEVPVATTTPAIQTTKEEMDKKIPTGKIEKNEPLVELEFINEFKTILVPTGAQVNILTARSGEGLTAIKEGVYLKIAVDDNSIENPNINYIDIIS